jgi:endonuclease/exonuclease/phosphatase family metal-dependent hydrolase
MEADIVCLQEVDVDLFPDLVGSLYPVFDGVLQRVDRKHNVATAVFVRLASPLRIVRDESRSRAQIVVLEVGAAGPTAQPSRSPHYLYLCNVHLDAGAKKSDPKLRRFHQEQRHNQLKSLLHRVDLQCRRDMTTIRDVPIVVAGDFNMLRTNPLHGSLGSGSLVVNGTVRLTDTYLEAERHGRGSKPMFRTRVAGETTATATTHRNVVMKKTFWGGSLLDYIWTSDRVQVLETLAFHPRSLRSGTDAVPSKDHPSDHFPIGIDIEWT